MIMLRIRIEYPRVRAFLKTSRLNRFISECIINVSTSHGVSGGGGGGGRVPEAQRT